MRTDILMRAVFFLLACCLTLSLALPTSAASPQKSEGQVSVCFDGDTLKLNDRRIVRLAGIDAPEVAHKNLQAQYYSREARLLLIKLAKGRKVSLLPAGSEEKDAYGRIIADVILPDGSSLSDAMVSSGAAFFYPHKNLTPSLQKRLLELQRQAMREKRGMWQHILSSPIAKQNYIGNRTSLRFFPEDCPEAQRIKPRKQMHFGTLLDAFHAGYAPARICPFWPTQK
ncbi:MAG: thermonuclease family protein [Desulfovibrio sp.]|nr:thermonuclease family protein [Desulfovibrio sp.]